jgi:hypothetical protein
MDTDICGFRSILGSGAVRTHPCGNNATRCDVMGCDGMGWDVIPSADFDTVLPIYCLITALGWARASTARNSPESRIRGGPNHCCCCCCCIMANQPQPCPLLRPPTTFVPAPYKVLNLPPYSTVPMNMPFYRLVLRPHSTPSTSEHPSLLKAFVSSRLHPSCPYTPVST